MQTTHDELSDYDLLKSFYVKGYHCGEFKQSSNLASVLDLFKTIDHEDLKKPYTWQKKFKSTQEMVPHEEVWKYDSALLEVLFENDIPELLQKLTGLNLFLNRVQIRQFNKGKSYTGVHRDVYDMGHSWKGPTPASMKLLFSPNLEDPKIDTFCVVKESHRKMTTNMRWDRLLLRLANNKKIKTSNNQFIIFNTAIGHGALDNAGPYCFRRLIYSFLQEPQLEADELNGELMKLYKNKRNLK
jgi:hypothetical protein